MNGDMLMLRLGEIMMKGRNRSRFENAVLAHVKRLLRAFPKANITKDYGRIYIDLGGESADELLKPLGRVFGITAIIPVVVCEPELKQIQEKAQAFIGSLSIKKDTAFKVSGRRVWKAFPHSSHDLNRIVSEPLLDEFPFLKVDVKNPELELRVEVRQDRALLYCQVFPGAGGFPLGTNGKAMLLLSGGIDSPVAGWSAMRRGLEVECVHFHSYPFTSRKAEEKVIELAKVLSQYSGRVKMHLVPFTDIQTSLAGAGQDNLMITLMRRAMLRIATKLAEQREALALVTGDSLGQVASQTLGSMNVIGRVTDLPLLRPLVMMDKQEIIDLSQRIGTYELSILPYEDCCTLFVPKSPATKPNLRVVENVERSLEGLEAMLEKAVQNTVTLTLTPDSQIRYEGDQLTGLPNQPRHELEKPAQEQVIREDWF
ncbi:tRNA uracil 4-sulfurtransferase ThiI [Paenibacillus yonginensis]|uniref:tRNA uracil 4-sulfurtransferase ThiI n=1 Tax=Paenibacillus yonginensis TaxID=1462996 RepID=UPI0008393334|nr:tRNA uracil 4-sulfurtransferase ThiI [Paenibacillus yonginensis]